MTEVTPDVRADAEAVSRVLDDVSGAAVAGDPRVLLARKARDRLLSRLDTLGRERDEMSEWAEHYKEIAETTEARLRAAEEALREVDDFLADPDGAPLDSIRLAREVIRAALAGVQAPAGEDAP
jgi:hypothetical protein